MMLPAVPLTVCLGGVFGDLTADPSREPWPAFERLFLGLNKDGEPPRQGTEVRIGRDEDCLRLLFICEDTLPWATLSAHDDPLYKEEVVEVFVDTEGDGLGYFEIEVNPNNAVLDGCMRRVRSGFRKDFRWHCEGLRTAVRLFSGGWAAELAIPFESLSGRRPAPGARWRVNFTRIDRPEGAPRELSSWSPTGYDQFHMPEKFGILTFE